MLELAIAAEALTRFSIGRGLPRSAAASLAMLQFEAPGADGVVSPSVMTQLEQQVGSVEERSEEEDRALVVSIDVVGTVDEQALTITPPHEKRGSTNFRAETFFGKDVRLFFSCVNVQSRQLSLCIWNQFHTICSSRAACVAARACTVVTHVTVIAEPGQFFLFSRSCRYVGCIRVIAAENARELRLSLR
jgi:hypothetical protein